MDCRSYLFVPGDQPARLAKAATSDADAVIIDLEDGVSASGKQAARTDLKTSVSLLRASGKTVAVRINGPGKDLAADLKAALIEGVAALVIPKCSCPDVIRAVSVAASVIEQERRLAATGFIALIENAQGVMNAGMIAAQSRVVALALGSEDFSLSLGVKPSFECLDMPVRMLILAASSCGKSAIAMPVSIAAFRDEETTQRAAQLARSLGGHGALCIHPLQVAIVNAVFAASDEERAEAEAILAGWADAQRRGEAVTTVNGRMVDAPVAAWAEQVRRRAGLMQTMEY